MRRNSIAKRKNCENTHKTWDKCSIFFLLNYHGRICCRIFVYN